MKKFESFESNVKTTEVARVFGSISMNTSHYLTIDNVLVRVSNHYPVFSNLQAYNDIDNLKGIIFVFIGENSEKFEQQMENDSDFQDLNVEILSFDLDVDIDFVQYMVNRKVSNF